MKKAFTLVELLVVVVVLVTLMGITFRISSVGGVATAKNYTVNRLQRIENCLSGYYAAFGSYPPVPLHGSRDYTYAVSSQGIQQMGGSSGSAKHESDLDWKRVEAACRSQPLGTAFPFVSETSISYLKNLAKGLQELAQRSDKKYDSYRQNPSLSAGFEPFKSSMLKDSDLNCELWTERPVFKFGLMSFLLPRYLFMLGHSTGNGTGSTVTSDFFDRFKQWTTNNQLPCRFDSGEPYDTWSACNSEVGNNRWKVALLPSQAVCARWLPNLEGVLQGGTGEGKTFYGINVIDSDRDAGRNFQLGSSSPKNIFPASGNVQASGNYGQQYALDSITCTDGWGEELYYYSPAPYQTYRLWSSGPNKKTFPPWITNEEIQELKGSEREDVQEWLADDIVQMSN